MGPIRYFKFILYWFIIRYVRVVTVGLLVKEFPQGNTDIVPLLFLGLSSNVFVRRSIFLIVTFDLNCLGSWVSQNLRKI